MTRRWPSNYGPDEILFMENVFEPLWRHENRSNSITNNMIDHNADIEEIEADTTQELFYDCRLQEVGGKRLSVLYRTKTDFSEAAQILNTKEKTLRSWIARLGMGLRLTGLGRKQLNRMLQTECDADLAVVNNIGASWLPDRNAKH